MEIQGLFAAQNIQHQQHGATCRTEHPQHNSVADKVGQPKLYETEAARATKPDLCGQEYNSKRARPSPFRLLSENGSGSVASHKNSGVSNTSMPSFAAIGLRNVNSVSVVGAKDQGGRETGSKGDFESDESGLHSAFPVFLIERRHREQQQQLQLQLQLQDGAFPQSTQDGEHAAVLNLKSKENEGFYVVFNIVREGESNCKEAVLAGGDAREYNAVDHGNIKKPKDAIMEPHILNSEEKVPTLVNARKAFSSASVSCSNLEGESEQVDRETAATPGLTKQACFTANCESVENNNMIPVTEFNNDNSDVYHAPDKNINRNPIDNMVELQQKLNRTRGLSFETPTSSETIQINNHQACIENSLDASLSETTSQNNGGGNSSGETFSGTITINNQSVLVTIENGVLTLAAPLGNNNQKEDAVAALKEHLGVKDNREIVLINCESASKTTTEKSVNKISKCSAASGSSGQTEEAYPGLRLSDSGLHLNKDLSFTDPSSNMDLGAYNKDPEDGGLCLDAADIVCPESRDGQPSSFIITDGGELQMKLDDGIAMMSKRGVMVLYHCSQVDCNETFDTKHKLKIHLLSHTEDQRPFKCTVEGCGWSFTTSYKLKRHLQSHDKVRPFACEWENCGRKFTTVYNLKAHIKAHEQENTFVCGVCSERFRTVTKLNIHQRTHFEPERPFKCEFPSCEKTFITFSALFSHNRAHFRETDQFSCSYPACDKRYDKACRLKIHMRSHTGERPFICDFEGCGWTFTSMSKLLRHKRKHDDDRRFTCKEEGCGKSFTRAEHLKGHSITHLGTKPFECSVEGCCAKFSARSSLYIHSKKHLQDGETLKSHCPISSCNKQFTSKSSMKTHMVKHHNFSPDLLSQLEITSSLTPSNELTSSGQGDLGNIDITSLFSSVPASTPGIAMDMSLVNSGILTIDAASVGATLGGGISVNNSSLTQTVDPLILAAGTDVTHGLDSSLTLGTNSAVLQQGTLNLDDVQTVNPEALGSLAALSMRTPSQDPLHGLTIDTATLTPSSSLGASHVPELLTPTKVERSLLASSDVIGQQEGSKVVTQFVFSSPTGSYSAQKELELNTVSGCSFLESGGSARTDYRAIQLAKKKKKQKGSSSPGGSSSNQRKTKIIKGNCAPAATTNPSSRFSGGVVSPNSGLTMRDPATGAQYVQIQLLQDDSPGDGDLAFQLSSQSSSTLPVNILQEPHTSTEDDAGSDNSQFTGSTINLQDLE
ncbi:zinc finger protein ZXDC-like [Acipenser ruthenus]|uniref:zinc finger protein ZXDC-like n=1 Tax=Acipenser ruthenus TaxID=7906 RepID=UPI002742715E|nr:zinc finger protein ZXDC-like [Acipenser ruthenus]